MNTTIQNSKDFLDYLDVFLDPILLIITFLLGYWISSWQLNRKEKKELDEQFDYFTLYLSKQSDSIKNQIQTIRETISGLENLKPFKVVQTRFIIQPIELLDTMNKAQITKSFQYKGFPPSDAVQLFVSINLCMENFKQYRESHIRFIQRQNEILLKWNEQIQDFHLSKMLSINLPVNEVIEIPELMTLNDYYNKLMEIEKPNDTPENLMKVCINPLIEYFKKLSEKDHTNRYANEYIPKLEKIAITYLQSEDYIKQQKEYLEKIIEVLNDNMEHSKINEYSA